MDKYVIHDDAKLLLDCAAMLASRAADKIRDLGSGIDDTEKWIDAHDLVERVISTYFTLASASNEISDLDLDDCKEETDEGS